MLNPPLSRRQPRPLNARAYWCSIAVEAYRDASRTWDAGPFLLADGLGIECVELDGEPRILGPNKISYTPDLSDYELAPLVYRAIAELLLLKRGESGPAAVAVVTNALILAPGLDADLDADELMSANPFVAHELLERLLAQRHGSGLMPVAG